MDHFKPLVWLSLIGLFAVFAVVSLLRFVFRKNASILKYKLKIGGIILTLSGMVMLNGCVGPPFSTCYTTESNYFSVTELDSIAYVNLNQTNRLRFNIFSNPAPQFMSYQLLDTNDTFIVSNDILPLDGVFNNNSEDFHVFLPITLTNGFYKLKFYFCSITSQDASSPVYQFNFMVSNF